jgi:glutaryl-CoA dehydrogenase (non-decarboxylating)
VIDFELSEEHIALQQTVREFCAGEVAPYIKEWDEKSHFERSVFDKMAELGLLGVCIPEQYGGAGFDYISLGIVCEELEACDTFLRVAMSVHVGLNSLSVFSWGTEEQKQKYLVPQAKGEKLATFGLTEPNAGSDVIGMRSYAKRDGDDWILNGEKMWISLGDRSGKAKGPRSQRDELLYRRADHARFFEWNTAWQAWYSCGEYRLLFAARCPCAERKYARQRGRGI